MKVSQTYSDGDADMNSDGNNDTDCNDDRDDNYDNSIGMPRAKTVISCE